MSPDPSPEPSPDPSPADRGATAVVTIAHGRHAHLRGQSRSLATGRRRPDPHVVVAMGDPDLAGWEPEQGTPWQVVDLPADPAELPLAAARNAGAEAALTAGAEVLVFLDVDCLAGDALVVDYSDAVRRRPGVVWSGPVTYLPPAPPAGYDLARLDALDDPHPARPAPSPGERVEGASPDLFWSLSFAVHRDTWRAVGGFCEDYVGYGGEDTDFAQLVVHRGFSLGWSGGARAYHQHHPTEAPPVQHVDAILRNGRLFHRRWGRWPMRGWLEQLADRGLVERRDAAGDEDWVRTG